MSSSIDAGYYADQQEKTLNEKCKKSKDGKHKWKLFGTYPSTWQECKNCKIKTYSK